MNNTCRPSFATSNTRDMGVYLHIPFCRKKCSYCDFASYEGLEAYYDDYVTALCTEIKLWAKKYPESTSIPVQTIYFGGGTPTQLSIPQIEHILNVLYKHYPCNDVIEVSMEANPGEIDKSYLQDLKSLGVTRLSYGVQTFDDSLLTLLRRGHTSSMAKQAITDALSVGFQSVSGDLIYALPGQHLKDIETNVKTLVDLGVSHISIYGLQLEEGTNLHKQVEQGQLLLPSDDENEAMYDCMLDQLASYGFERYEISNFTNNQAYSHHNLRYWQYKEYLAFGAGAYSFYTDVRRNNEPYVVPYITRLRQELLPVVFEETISETRSVEDFCFLALRTKWGLSKLNFEQRFNQSLLTIFGNELEHLNKQGLLQQVNDSWCLTRDGAKHGNYVFSQFIR
ncbi:radical SAM family heme chaperone HemW [Veillonella criceti]|uniref:Heme chaperone HemW n=1 Tax=Veillonella criceti TaxID=103891 RepID=A0A380NI75_9FIRM|nr:radical SAM family heme chaperone HemW [Veillonella criceti]SUP41120.1 Oxygen-independent coproporphyrinogen-III oxidase [Veillonella criceti]